MATVGNGISGRSRWTYAAVLTDVVVRLILVVVLISAAIRTAQNRCEEADRLCGDAGFAPPTAWISTAFVIYALWNCAAIGAEIRYGMLRSVRDRSQGLMLCVFVGSLVRVVWLGPAATTLGSTWLIGVLVVSLTGTGLTVAEILIRSLGQDH